MCRVSCHVFRERSGIGEAASCHHHVHHHEDSQDMLQVLVSFVTCKANATASITTSTVTPDDLDSFSTRVVFSSIEVNVLVF